MSAITIPNPLPAQVVLAPDLVAQAGALVERAAAIVAVESPEDLQAAEASFLECDDLAKAIHDARMEITRKIDAWKKTVMAAEDTATGPLTEQSKRLRKEIAAFRAEVERQRREAERRRMEEQRRREEEARRLAEEQERKRREEAELFGVASEPEPAPVVEAPPIEPEPIEQIDLGKAALETRYRTVLRVVDADAVPVSVAGKCIRPVDEKAAEALMKAGVPVPGCVLEKKPYTAKARR